ncbi:MAG: GNAT family N-acetyltransferase [Butyricicoccaceae bacterium]
MILETERLRLRPFSESDAADVLEYLHRPAVHCFADQKLDSIEDARAEMRRRAQSPDWCLAIVLKDTGRVIGEISAYPERSEPHSPRAPLDTFSPCWMLNAAYQGKGYAFEAARAFFDDLFAHKGARRIYAYTEEDNLPSQHLCEKLGMRREGVFQEFVSFVDRPDGTPLYENTIQYAVLKKEWR